MIGAAKLKRFVKSDCTEFSWTWRAIRQRRLTVRNEFSNQSAANARAMIYPAFFFHNRATK